MLRLPEAIREFKITEKYDFITNQGGPKRLLPQFLDSLSGLSILILEILKEPLRDLS